MEHDERDDANSFPHASADVLRRIADSGIDVEVVSALGFVPCVMVAWAEGDVGEREREAVLGAAKENGLVPGTRPYTLLAGWLDEEPSASLIDLWSRYVSAFCEGLSPSDREALRDRVLRVARAVAEANGGFLGVGRISDAEEAMLRRIAQAFRC